MKIKFLKLLFMVLLSQPVCFGAEQPPQQAEIAGYYDKAFNCYLRGEYQKAIETWDLIIRTDPKQVTARKMIEEARQKLAGGADSLKKTCLEFIAKGLYLEAFKKAEEMLDSDSGNTSYQKLRAKLRKISAIAPQRKNNSKAWAIAGAGINSWTDDKEDLLFAYDALRYSLELAPAEKIFLRLVTELEEEAPQLKLNDTKPANTPLLEHKKDVALRHIYDSKFYLAAKELETVLRLEPKDITALKRIGSAYLQLKDYQRARMVWQKAAKLSPDDEQLKEYLAALDKAAPGGSPKTKKRRAKKA